MKLVLAIANDVLGCRVSRALIVAHDVGHAVASAVELTQQLGGQADGASFGGVDLGTTQHVPADPVLTTANGGHVLCYNEKVEMIKGISPAPTAPIVPEPAPMPADPLPVAQQVSSTPTPAAAPRELPRRGRQIANTAKK